jgi:hypothetical protein
MFNLELDVRFDVNAYVRGICGRLKKRWGRGVDNQV